MTDGPHLIAVEAAAPRANLWAKHYLAPWVERSRDESLPKWLRVAAIAYGAVNTDGHAPLARGELRRRLSVGGVECRNPERAVRQAIEKGWLAAGSGTRCLIVPSHAVSNDRARPTHTCPEHGRI